MSTRARKRGKAEAKDAPDRRLRDMNAALLVSAVRQHEANEELERSIAERTAALTQYQQRLRELVKELGRAATHERMRLAGELHDNLVQLLAVCKMKASTIEVSAPPGSSMAADALAVKQFLSEAIDYARTLMSDLRPDTLNEHDLTAAVQWVAKRMQRHGLVVRVEDDGDPKPLEEDLLVLLFDSVRELLFNVVKHAGTGEATVSLRRSNGEVHVTVSDEGAGFDRRRQLSPSKAGGFGLFSIAERLNLLGGRAEVESARGRGTSVRLVAPLASQRGAHVARARRQRRLRREPS